MDRNTLSTGRILDPLVSRALRLFGARLGPEPNGGSVEDVAGQLLADELLVSSSFDVGIWGRPIFKAAAESAARLQRVAVNGDEA